MTRTYLQNMVEALPEGVLPPEWNDFDLASFSRGKRLWDYQQRALRNALRALWKYYSMKDATEAERKAAYLAWYREAGMAENLDLTLDRSTAAKRRLAGLVERYFGVDNDRLPYEQLINRMSFWMATGSGKTLVLVKLIEVLHGLMARREIPARDLLVLTFREDLLAQLRKHVEEYNSAGGLFIRLRELRDYAEAKRAAPSLLEKQELTVFYYRSDNLSDEQKEKIVDFRNFDQNGEWYVLLDEAHKGDAEDSKRKHIYSILARNGFLFNFSATFVDKQDIVTTVANFNLSEFTRRGYGKHIAILKQEIRAFRKGDEYTDLEKQKIVLKALMMLACARQIEERVRGTRTDLYHRPLLMTLVNSVNTEEADLKLFFRELARIGNGEVDEATWRDAKAELLSELRDCPEFLYETGCRARVDLDLLEGLTQSEVLRTVYNAPSSGEIEVLARPSDQQEVAFKLKTSDQPFALIRIGDISYWKNLAGYTINQHFADEGFFEQLNRPDSEINILLGSRSFYEGWDSNRPNVIMYINIGTGTEAKKFILQSVGRGVRIEPVKNKRKRLRALLAGGELSAEERAALEPALEKIETLESVFVFGTNRQALNLVMEELDQEDERTGEREISLALNEEAVRGKTLLIPTYRASGELVSQERSLARFALTGENLDLLQRYLDYVKDDRVFLALHGTPPQQISALRESLQEPGETYRTDGARPYRNLPVLVRQAAKYFGLLRRDLSGFKPLEDEINHFRHIKVALEALGDLEWRIQQVLESVKLIQNLRAQYQAQQLTFEDYERERDLLSDQQSGTFSANNTTLAIRRIANHYYIPVLLSDHERVDFIRSVIHYPSEINFLRLLEDYLRQRDQGFKTFDWWLFSRIDENLDGISIPYYDPEENRVANFKPDFIFWLKKGDRYEIVFMDPKGTRHTDYEHKVAGYRMIFEENGKPRVYQHEGMAVRVWLFLYTQDRNRVEEPNRRYWFDRFEQVVSAIA